MPSQTGPFPGSLISEKASILFPQKTLVKKRSERITSPSHIWTLDTTHATTHATTQKGTLIRQEYVELILAILEWMKLAIKIDLAYRQSTEEFAKKTTQTKQLDREKKSQESPTMNQ